MLTEHWLTKQMGPKSKRRFQTTGDDDHDMDDEPGSKKHRNDTASELPYIPFSSAAGSTFGFVRGMETTTNVYTCESPEKLAERSDLSEFVRVSPSQLANLWRSTDRLTDESVACNILANLLFREAPQVETTRRQFMPRIERDEIQRIESTIWDKWLRDCHRSKCEVGFVPVAYIPHDVLGYQPVVIDLSLVDVFHHRNIYSRNSYLYRWRGIHGSNDPFLDSDPGATIKRSLATGKYQEGYGFLSGIMTFTYKPPDRWGNIMSKMAICIRERMVIERQKSLAIEAQVDRAQPKIFTEAEGEKPSGGWTDLMEVAKHVDESKERLDTLNAAVAQLTNRIGAPAAGAALMAKNASNNSIGASASLMATRMRSVMDRKVDLEPGRKIAIGPVAEVPEHLIESEQLMRSKIALVFGLPVHYLVPREAKISSSDQIDQETLEGTISHEKEEARTMMYEVYHAINDHPNLLHYIHETEIDKVTVMGARAAVTVKIDLPSAPPMEGLHLLYDKGLLKAEAMNRMAKKRYGLNDSDFNEHPIPPKTEYIEPKPAAATAKPKKKTAKKKKS